MFDAFKQAKLQSAYSTLKNKIPDKDMSLDELKRLSGSGKITGENTLSTSYIDGAKRAQYIRDNNIKPGTQEWFRVRFAKPALTGENPYE